MKKIFKLIVQLVLNGIFSSINLVTSCILIQYWKLAFSQKIWTLTPFPYMELGILIGTSVILIGLWLLEIYFNSKNN